MNCKAILSNKTRPEFGQVTVPLPIPDSEYDHAIGLLEDLGIGPGLPGRWTGQPVSRPQPAGNSKRQRG